MLRLLDADGAGASVSDFLDHIALEEIDLSEAATRRTLAFAKGFWKRL
jgi:hypothetical protein